MSLREVLDVLYPRAAVCLCCGDPRRADEKYCLCPDCREALTKLRLREGICLRCMSVLDAHGNCPFCAGGSMEGLREGYVAYRHTGVARQLVAELKYRYCNEAAAALAAGMASCAPAYQYDALVPVPLHKRRQRMRGANQADLLCCAAAPRLGLPVLNALERVRDTRVQAKLPRAGRLKNVQGAFVVRMDVRGLRLLLVDDVRTTGATSRECARMLLKAGAKYVGILTATAPQRNGGDDNE